MIWFAIGVAFGVSAGFLLGVAWAGRQAPQIEWKQTSAEEFKRYFIDEAEKEIKEENKKDTPVN